MADFEFTKRVLFIGVPDMAFVGIDTLTYAGVNIVGVIGPKKTHNMYQTFKNFVKSRSLNFIEYDSIKDDSLIETIKLLNVDIAVVNSFNDKIPKKFIDAIPNGIINVHPSLLPYYRGGNPYSRVIMNGEKKTGVTLHFMSEEFDTGDIIAQEVCEVDPKETMGTIFNKTNAIGASMLVKALMYFEKHGNLPRTKQPDGEFITAPNLKDEEMVINYNVPAEQTERLIRALNPYFSAMTFFKNTPIKIYKASVDKVKGIEEFSNGEICKIEQDKIYIKTADGCLIPEIMQYGGYFTGDCTDLIHFIKAKVGEKFTNGYT